VSSKKPLEAKERLIYPGITLPATSKPVVYPAGECRIAFELGNQKSPETTGKEATSITGKPNSPPAKKPGT